MKQPIAPLKTEKRGPASTDYSAPSFVTQNGPKLTAAYSEFFALNMNTHTNDAYANGLRLFFEHCASIGIMDVLDIEPAHVQDFNLTILDKGYGKSSLRQYLSAVRMFFDSCVVKGVLSINPPKRSNCQDLRVGQEKRPLSYPSKYALF